jgi:hypothetical protein
MLRRRNTVLRRMESFCSGKELEAHVLYTTESLEDVFAKQGWDLIVRRKDNHFLVYGMEQNYHVDDLEEYFEEKGKDLIEAGYTIDFIIE